MATGPKAVDKRKNARRLISLEINSRLPDLQMTAEKVGTAFNTRKGRIKKKVDSRKTGY